MRTYAISTDCHRQPGGQNILRSVDIPIMSNTATTHPLTHVERHCVSYDAARRAQLRRRKPAIDHDHLASIPTRLVLQHAPKLRPRRIRDRPSESAISEQVAHAQILDYERLVLTHDSRRDLVQIVTPTVCDTRMDPSDSETRFGPVGRVLLLATQFALGFRQSSAVSAFMAGVGDLLARGQGKQGGQPHVDPDRPIGTGQWHNRGVLAQHGHKPTPGRVPRHCYRGRFARQSARPHDIEWFIHLRQEQFPRTPPKARPRVLGTCPGLLPRLEMRIPGALGPKVGERGLQVPQRLLQRHRRHLSQVGVVFIALPSGEHRRSHGVVNTLTTLPRGGPSLEGEVVDLAHTPECSFQFSDLGRGRVAPVLESSLHPLTHASQNSTPVRNTVRYSKGGVALDTSGIDSTRSARP